MAKRTLKKVKMTSSDLMLVELKPSESKEKLTKDRLESIKLLLTEIVLLGHEEETNLNPKDEVNYAI